MRRLFHVLDHATCGAALYAAGEAVTYRRRAGWLVVGALAGLRCHRYHHGGHP